MRSDLVLRAKLRDVDDRPTSLRSLSGPGGLVVVFVRHYG